MPIKKDSPSIILISTFNLNSLTDFDRDVMQVLCIPAQQQRAFLKSQGTKKQLLFRLESFTKDKCFSYLLKTTLIRSWHLSFPSQSLEGLKSPIYRIPVLSYNLLQGRTTWWIQPQPAVFLIKTYTLKICLLNLNESHSFIPSYSSKESAPSGHIVSVVLIKERYILCQILISACFYYWFHYNELIMQKRLEHSKLQQKEQQNN